MILDVRVAPCVKYGGWEAAVLDAILEAQRTETLTVDGVEIKNSPAT